jgi:hypothetical protein
LLRRWLNDIEGVPVLGADPGSVYEAAAFDEEVFPFDLRAHNNLVGHFLWNGGYGGATCAFHSSTDILMLLVPF